MSVFRIAGLLLLGFAPGAISAQATHRINGSQLQATIRSANAGDIVIVTGWVNGFTIYIDKPLHIHGANAIWWGGPHVEISGVPKGAELTFNQFASVPTINVRKCQGSVLLTNLTGGDTNVFDSADVSVTSCKLGGVTVENSRVTIADSTLTGRRFNTRFPMWPASHGVKATNSSVTVSNSTITGGWKFGDLAAIQLDKSSLWITRSTLQNLLVTGVVPGVNGNGSMLYDPSLTWRLAKGAKPIAAGVTATRRSLPNITMLPSAIGSRATVAFRGQVASTYGIFVGLPGAPVTLPGISGAFQLSVPVLVQVGKVPSTGSASLSFMVPNVANLRGQHFRWQGIVVAGASGEWSNAVTECHY